MVMRICTQPAVFLREKKWNMLDSVVTKYFPKQPGIWSERQQEMKTNFCNIWLQRLASVSDVKMRFRLTFWFYTLFCRIFSEFFDFFAPAFAQSAVTPSVTTHRTGTPRASTNRCILVLSPLLCARFPGFRLALRRRAHAPSPSSRRSLSIPVRVRL